MVPNPKRCKIRLHLIAWSVLSIHWIHYKDGRSRWYGNRYQKSNMKNKHHNTHRWYHSTSWKQGWHVWTDKMSQKQQWDSGSQFQPKESYSNEQCGKSKHLFRWWRYLHNNQLQVFGGFHHQWELHQWRDQEKNKLEQSTNCKFDKNHKRLGSFNPTQN